MIRGQMVRLYRHRLYSHAIKLNIVGHMVSANELLYYPLYIRYWFVVFVVNDPVTGWLKGRHLKTDCFGCLYGRRFAVFTFELVLPGRFK